MKKGVLYTSVLFILFFVILPITTKADVATADIRCVEYRTSFGLKEAYEDPSNPGIWIGDIICNDQCPSDPSWSYVDEKKCVDAGFASTDWSLNDCFYDSKNNAVAPFSVIDSAKCAAAPCNLDEECHLLNPLVTASYLAGRCTDPIPSNGVDVWKCVSKGSTGIFHINLFGVDLGPAHIALAKIIRTGFTAGLIFYGVYSGWEVFTAIWDSMTGRTQEKYETSQKRVIGALIGLFWVAVGIILLQLLSSFFGISGNIFEFSYTT